MLQSLFWFFNKIFIKMKGIMKPNISFSKVGIIKLSKNDITSNALALPMNYAFSMLYLEFTGHIGVSIFNFCEKYFHV